MRRRYLVTGGAGFLGSPPAARLLHEGPGGLCGDNFFFNDKTKIEPLFGNPTF